MNRIHRPYCPHPPNVNCRFLPLFIGSLDAAFVYAERIDPRADLCAYCFEQEIRGSDARVFR